MVNDNSDGDGNGSEKKLCLEVCVHHKAVGGGGGGGGMSCSNRVTVEAGADTSIIFDVNCIFCYVMMLFFSF